MFRHSPMCVGRDVLAAPVEVSRAIMGRAGDSPPYLADSLCGFSPRRTLYLRRPVQSDAELLRSYVQDRSESAFTELVQRHIDLVYSAVLRAVHGDAFLAEDVTQAVFAELARKASSLVRHPALAGWLYTCVRQMAANVRRAEDRRQRREQEAHAMNELLSSDPSEAVWRQGQPV